MTDLTEQWKSGELKFGAYYVNRLEEHRIWLYNDRSKTPESQHEIYEVLAPVPSYEEWKASYNCMLENEVLRLKNAQLKELLKECREILDYAKDFAYHDPCCKCVAKINQVLGEK